MAPKFVAMDTGPERHSVVLQEGAAITGRLLANGKPMGNVEIGLIAKDRGSFRRNLTIQGNPYDEVRIGTKPDGSFTITNVPEPVTGMSTQRWIRYRSKELQGHFCPTPRKGLIGASRVGACEKSTFARPKCRFRWTDVPFEGDARTGARIKVREP
jgi:hypothetical protein